MKAIRAERTFWEKATILHQEAHRPKEKIQPPRYSRHYYEVEKTISMLVSWILILGTEKIFLLLMVIYL